MMRFKTLVACCAVSLFACPNPPEPCVTGDEDTCDAGAVPSDGCNSQDEASGADCTLTLGQAKEGFISTLDDGGVDKDWYSVQLGPLTAQSLLHVRAGYTVPQTPVTFSVNVLTQSGGNLVSVATGADTRVGSAAPKPVDLIQPFSTSNATLFLLVSDTGATPPRVDNRNPYSVFVEVTPNPDSNEPNDTVATPIPLTAMGAIMQSAAAPNAPGGYLATNNDVDRFSFEVTGATRQVAFVRITAPSSQTAPAKYRLSYTLLNPMMQPISEGQMANEFQPVDLSTARLVTAGKYTLVVQGYRSPQTPNAVVPGNLALKYAIDVRVMPDVDLQEPNDTQATAKSLTLSVGQSQTLTGRISAVPDEEWFKVSLPPSGPAVIRYKVTPAMTGGRFPALSATPARQLRVLKPVTTGATAQERQNACLTNTVCPNGSEDPGQRDLVASLCRASDPPNCIWAQRNEAPRFANLKNVEGTVPVPAHTAPLDYFLLLSDQGLGASKWADDKDYTLSLSIEDDTDEAGRQSGPELSTLSTAQSTLSGKLTFGHGRLINDFDVNTGVGVRGPQDYDAVPTDVDAFQVDFGGAMGARAWSIEWETDTDGGAPPGELTLDVNFCDSTAVTADGGCAGPQALLSYTSSEMGPWYAPTYAARVKQFREELFPGLRRVTLLPAACACFGAPQVAAGKFFVRVGAANRVSHDVMTYRVKQSIGAYPQSYTGGRDGGSGTCPVVDAGGGCGFVPSP